MPGLEDLPNEVLLSILKATIQNDARELRTNVPKVMVHFEIPWDLGEREWDTSFTVGNRKYQPSYILLASCSSGLEELMMANLAHLLRSFMVAFLGPLYTRFRRFASRPTSLSLHPPMSLELIDEATARHLATNPTLQELERIQMYFSGVSRFARLSQRHLDQFHFGDAEPSTCYLAKALFVHEEGFNGIMHWFRLVPAPATPAALLPSATAPGSTSAANQATEDYEDEF